MQGSTEQLARYSTASFEEAVVSPSALPSGQPISNKIMSVCRNTVRWIFLLDLVLALSILVLLSILEFGIVPQQKIGFFCNDPRISFKFTGDTVPMSVLIVGSIAIPLVMMWLTEYLCHASDSYSTLVGCLGSRMKQLWLWYGHYTIGIVTLAFICDVMKVLIGEPRPHFLDTCRPREAFNCTTEYFSSYTCTNVEDSTWMVSDSSKSFPSGHAALSVYTTIFMMWYLQNRLPSDQTFFLRPWLQCLMLLWSVTCSLTRIGDNRHHWWDVVAGLTLGALFSSFIVTLPCKKFYWEKTRCTRHPRNERDRVEQVQR